MLLEMQSPTCDWAFGQRGALKGRDDRVEGRAAVGAARKERLTESGVLNSGSQGRRGTEAAVPTELR
jgi:hypothetical protein